MASTLFSGRERELLLTLFRAGVRSVQPELVLAELDLDAAFSRALDAYRSVILVSIGKAAFPWVSALYSRLEARGAVPAASVAVAPAGYRATIPAECSMPAQTEVFEGGHPLPDEGSIRAADRILASVDPLGIDDLLIVAVSGGGTSACNAFSADLALDDVRQAYRSILESGLSIREANVVRKHLSAFSGGRLAARAYPAEVVAFVASDVPGDDLSTISSGPLSPDESTFADAREIVATAGLMPDLPAAIRRHLERGSAGLEEESPTGGHRCFDRVRSLLLATNGKAREGVARAAVEAGLSVAIIPDEVTGEASVAGRHLARRITSDCDSGACIVSGGETTVTVRGDGRGGRNQELALAAAIELDGLERYDVHLLSAGTDGIDGPTPAAGGIVNGAVVNIARVRGLNPIGALENHDSYRVLKACDALIHTGPTHTNVMDLQIALRGTPH